MKNCWDILIKYFTDKEIKEAKKTMLACGCSVCCIRYLTSKFPKRVPPKEQMCYGA